jgi:hypothetical protein
MQSKIPIISLWSLLGLHVCPILFGLTYGRRQIEMYRGSVTTYWVAPAVFSLLVLLVFFGLSLFLALGSNRTHKIHGYSGFAISCLIVAFYVIYLYLSAASFS